jgi:hypothetical protein
VSDSDHGEQEELALWMLSTAWKHDLDHDLTSPLGMFAVHCAGIALEMRNHTEWLPIETAPLDRDVMLGWWVIWPEREWKVEYGWAGKSNSCPPGISNAWLHGQATHWFSPQLPAPPEASTQSERDHEPIASAS